MVILINFLKLIALVLCSAGVTAILNCYMKNRKFRVNALANIFIMTVVAVSLFMFGGISVWTVKGIVMALVLLYASVQDISTRKADDNLWIMLLILSLVNFGEHSVLSMILGGLVVFVPQLAIAIFSKNGGIGGADITPLVHFIRNLRDKRLGILIFPILTFQALSGNQYAIRQIIG